MSISIRQLGTVLFLAVAVMLSLPASAADTRQSLSGDSVIETIKQRGAIKIGLSLFIPWSMRDKTGELIGYELDVGRKLAKDMGVDAEFVPTSWDGIIPALISGKFDAIISGMSVTANRNLTVNFTDPYAFSGLTILANRKMTQGFSEDDFNKEGIIFAARRGATPAVVIANSFPNATLLLFDEDGASAQEVLNGKAHATMASEPTPSREARKYPETLHIPFETKFDPRGEGFAIRKGDPDALNYFNNWIAHNWRTGWLKSRHDYWFTTNDWADQMAQ